MSPPAEPAPDAPPAPRAETACRDCPLRSLKLFLEPTGEELVLVQSLARRERRLMARLADLSGDGRPPARPLV